MVVWYFDTAMAVDAELSEEDMELALTAGELLCPVEVSTTRDVRAWIKAPKR